MVAARRNRARGDPRRPRHQVSPGIERYDLFGIAPLRVRSDVLYRAGIREIGDMIVGERPRRTGEGRDRPNSRRAWLPTGVAVIGVAQGRDTGPRSAAVGAPQDEMRRSVMLWVADPVSRYLNGLGFHDRSL